MEIRNRLFPYPVLCGETDDYNENVEFVIEPSMIENTYDVLFDYEFGLKCDALETLLRKGLAQFVLHIECSTTAFRIALKSEVPHIEYRLPKSKVNGEVQLVAMIVAITDIPHYESKDLNEDYIGENIDIKKGDILAFQNIPSVFISKKSEELANNESFFSVIKRAGLDPDEVKPLTFNLHNDRIQIIVDEKTYEAFIRFQHSRSIAMALLILPTLTYMVTEVSNNPDSYFQFQWFQKMTKFYQSQGKDFIEDIIRKDDNPVNIAQEMIDDPVSKAYRELYALEG